MTRFLTTLVVVAAVCLGHGSAGAQSTAADWATVGRKHLVAGRYQQAIDAYKRAFAQTPKVTYRCNVGVAAYRGNQLLRAHLTLGECLRNKATLRAPVVANISTAFAHVERTLRRGSYVPIHVTVTPAHATLTVSFLAADDTFAGGRTVWVPPGVHTIDASAAGYRTQTVRVTAPKGKTIATTIVLVASGKQPPATGQVPPPIPVPIPLPTTKPAPPAVDNNGKPPGDTARTPPATAVARPAPAPAPAPGPPASTASTIANAGQAEGPPRTRRRAAWLAFGAGTVALAAGVVFHVRALGTVDEVKAQQTQPAYDDKAAQLRREQYWVGGLYGTAALAAGIGTYLWLRASPQSSARIGSTVAPHSATVWASWRL